MPFRQRFCWKTRRMAFGIAIFACLALFWNIPPGRADQPGPETAFFESHKSSLVAVALIVLLLLIITSQALNSARIRKAEAVLRRSEERYRYIYESTAVAIREEDYTRVKSMIDAEKARGVKDFGRFLDHHPEFVRQAAEAVQVTDVNRAAIRLYEAGSQHRLLGPLSGSFSPESYPAFKQVLAAIAGKQERIEFESSASTYQGRTLHLLISIRLPRTPENFRRVLVCINDITRIKETEAKLEKYRLHLEELVKERTAELDHAVTALQSSLRQIGETQAQLAKAEKMAALGGLVAGVAHEINTPIGIGVTAVSFLQDETRRFRRRWAGSIPGLDALDDFMDTVAEISTNVLSSLKRAAELVHSFKQVAVDQTIEERRTINLAKYINETLLTLTPRYKKTAHTITVHCPPDLELKTYPGAISQIVTNLVMNSLTHGFEGIAKGDIQLSITGAEGQISLHYSDNGRGMDQTTLSRAFEHFFTTNRKHGGTGLGLNIVHNLVTGKLKGTIECTSEPGKGVVFMIQIPASDETGAASGKEAITRE